MEAEIFESFYDSMSQRDKYHMANKLYKVDEIAATKVVNELHELKIAAQESLEAIATFINVWDDNDMPDNEWETALNAARDHLRALVKGVGDE